MAQANIIKNSFYLHAEEEKDDDVPQPDYTDEERTYLSYIKKRLYKAKKQRDKPHREFDGMTYLEYWRSNEKLANTFLEGVKNKTDVDFQSGTLRTKLMAFLSSFQTLNLEPEIDAFDDKQMVVAKLGDAIQTIIRKTEEVEGDREMQMLRQYEMLKHGYVFVEEIWQERWNAIKEITSGEIGEVSSVNIKTTNEKDTGNPVRTLIDGPSVYLGDINQYFMEKRPYIFTVKTLPREEARAIYGGWERWKYVSRHARPLSSSIAESLESNTWRLQSDLKENEVEVVKYQDKPHNEFQIFLNGVPMLPIGFPLTEVSPDGSYTIVQQNLEPIRHSFAYGKSFVFNNKNLIAVLDEMMKMAVLKTQKSFMPPYLNTSDRIISRSVFMPGRITRGIPAASLVPLTEHEVKGVTSSEFSMISEVKRFIDENTVSPTFTGQQEGGANVTATQILEIQKQARMMLALLTLAATLLEKKLTKKRLKNVLVHWFNPIDQEVDQARGILAERYRRIAYKTQVEEEGTGVKMVIASERSPTSKEIRQWEDSLQANAGMPVRISVVNPRLIKEADYVWVIHITPRAAESSESSKLMFKAMVQDMHELLAPLGVMPNPDYITKRFGQVWGEDSSKMFMQTQTPVQQPRQPQPQGQPQGRQPRTASSPRIAPQVKVPSGNQQPVRPANV